MPTSGLVVIPRTSDMARTLRDQLTAHRVAKKYYARVIGRFPTYAPCAYPSRVRALTLSRARVGGADVGLAQ
jgi:23S rRNA-/tRNA-specific pseudouridylate synthase